MPALVPRYVALLRAVNVGGRSVIAMADLRTHFTSFGLKDVVTYIQSGNVLFTTAEDIPCERLARQLETHLEAAFGRRVTVFVLTPRQLQQAAAQNPFEPELRDREQQCHLMFLSGEPSPDRCAALMALQGDDYQFSVWGNVLYYAYPRTLAGSRRTIDFEKVLGVTGTARTWKVVQKLIELAQT